MLYIIIDMKTMKAYPCDNLSDFESIQNEQCVVIPTAFPESPYDNIFHDALDLQKVKETLYHILNMKDEKAQDVFRYQKLWFVVHRVFMEMDWLQVTMATKFRQWAEDVFGEKGRCTKLDFAKVSARFKNKHSTQWKAYADKEKPYVEVARTMRQLFQGENGKNEKTYLKLNRFIYHPLNIPR